MSKAEGGKKKGLLGLTREERDWVMYDWANSVYATIMMAALFPAYFTGIVNNQLGTGRGDYWWGIGTSVAMALIAIAAPFVGALADFKGYKKKLFIFFLSVGLAFTLLCALTDNWLGMLIGYAVSHIGFSGSCLVYDSFLPDVTTPDRMDRVSSYGYALGYIGGSTIPFLAAIALMQLVDTVTAVKIGVVIAVVWWGAFSIPFILNIKHKHYVERTQHGIAKQTIQNVVHTAKKLFADKKIFYFILAYFFYIDGVGTVIKMSTSYGTTLGLDTTGMILALLVTQLVAFPCSILFNRLAKRFGSLQMLTAAVMLYLGICIVGFIMGFGLETEWFGLGTGQILFWVLAFMVGMVQGGIQAISRSHFAKLVTPENAGEYFGFFDIFGRFASVLGPALYALVNGITGRSSFAILSIISLFLIALVIMLVKRKDMGA